MLRKRVFDASGANPSVRCVLARWRWIFLVIAVSLLSGCATAGIETAGGLQVPDAEIYSTFAQGQARLRCGAACSGAWGYARRNLKQLHDTGAWRELALQVARIGHDSNLGYFYLGRAAEGLGLTEAAKSYYLVASGALRCDAFINNCDGFQLPQLINTRLESMERAASIAREQARRREAQEARNKVQRVPPTPPVRVD